MIVYLVRHARAGHRAQWDGNDTLRPLDERGRRQAELLVDQLEGALELFASADVPWVASVHGDLVEGLLGESAKKGETIVLEVEDGEVRVLERWPPQA